MAEYHLQYFGPSKTEYVEWPEGSVSVYRITGSQIADREIRSEIVKGGTFGPHYSGEVIARHPWCGFLGCFRSLDEAVTAIKADRAEQKRMDDAQAARKAKA